MRDKKTEYKIPDDFDNEYDYEAYVLTIFAFTLNPNIDTGLTYEYLADWLHHNEGLFPEGAARLGKEIMYISKRDKRP